MKTNEELRKLVNDTIVYVDELCPAWDMSRNDKRAMQNAIQSYVDWKSDEIAVLSCYYMLETFGLQSSDNQKILDFMLDEDVVYILDNAE